MIQLIIKKHIEKRKLDALIYFLKSWNIAAELRTTPPVGNAKKQADFSLAAGIWSDYPLDSKELRTKAWKRNQ